MGKERKMLVDRETVNEKESETKRGKQKVEE